MRKDITDIGLSPVKNLSPFVIQEKKHATPCSHWSLHEWWCGWETHMHAFWQIDEHSFNTILKHSILFPNPPSLGELLNGNIKYLTVQCVCSLLMPCCWTGYSSKFGYFRDRFFSIHINSPCYFFVDSIFLNWSCHKMCWGNPLVYPCASGKIRILVVLLYWSDWSSDLEHFVAKCHMQLLLTCWGVKLWLKLLFEQGFQTW